MHWSDWRGACCCWWQWWLIRVLDQKGSLHHQEKSEISPGEKKKSFIVLSSNMYFQYLHFATGFYLDHKKPPKRQKQILEHSLQDEFGHWRGTASWPHRMTQGALNMKTPNKLRKGKREQKKQWCSRKDDLPQLFDWFLFVCAIFVKLLRNS